MSEKLSRDEWLREESRLIILRMLEEEPNWSLHSPIILRELRERWRVTRDRPWLHIELDYLAELGAISVVNVETIKIATLLERGKRHIDGEIILHGVKRPTQQVL